MLKEIFILAGNSAGIISLILIIIFWLKLRRCDKKVDLISKRIEQLEWRETLRHGKMKAKEWGINEGQVEEIVDAHRR